MRPERGVGFLVRKYWRIFDARPKSTLFKALTDVLRTAALAGCAAMALHAAALAATPSTSISLAGFVTIVSYILVLGTAAAIFKSVNQYRYGQVEVAFALVSAWRFVHVGMSADQSQNLVALGALTYVMSRGVLNWYDGYVKEVLPAQEAEFAKFSALENKMRAIREEMASRHKPGH